MPWMSGPCDEDGNLIRDNSQEYYERGLRQGNADGCQRVALWLWCLANGQIQPPLGVSKEALLWLHEHANEAVKEFPYERAKRLKEEAEAAQKHADRVAQQARDAQAAANAAAAKAKP